MIRPLEGKDLQAVYSILCYWIEHSSANLSWNCPSYSIFSMEQIEIAGRCPYLVAEYEGEVIGFGYAHPFLAKEAYQFDAELTIYFRNGDHHHLADPLYEALESICRSMGFVRLISCTTSENHPSLNFQKKHGFHEYGRLENAGYKNGRWLDVSWLEKQIGSRDHPQRFALPEEFCRI